ncbi:MAG: urease accessory protein UreD, partial [Pseudomonadota bacterium]|nr:urease accessory protein UreD [Pseudomonadota bacterium]
VSDPKHLSAAAGLRDYPMQGLFVATGGTEELLEACRDVLAEAQTKLTNPLPAGLTLLEDLIVLRVLGISTEKMQSLMIPVWQLLRQKVLNKGAEIPRIWNT